VSTSEIKLPTWVWALIIVFVIILATDHGDALWVARGLWHFAGHVIGAIERGLHALHSRG
jgi:hypothetical protein